MRKNKAHKRGRNFKSIFLAIFVLGFLGLTSAGCGYTTHSLISAYYRTIYVSAFVNKIDISSETSVARRYKTYYPLLENDITRKVISQFTLDGSLRLAQEEDADLILEGELTDYRRDALAYSGTDDETVQEYRISLVVNVKLYDTSAQTLLWQSNIIGDATYSPDSKSESAAIADAIADLARRIVNRTIDIW